MSKKQKERWTDELKEEWSKKMSGESNPFYGRTHSEETKEKLKKRIVNEDTRDKISKANKGKRMSENNHNSKKIICIESGRVFDCISDALEFMGKDRRKLRRRF